MSHHKGGKVAEVPERRCIVTGEVRAKEDLLRVVIGPDGSVVPDLEERLPGRGLWLCPSRDVINTACAKNAFAKARDLPIYSVLNAAEIGAAFGREKAVHVAVAPGGLAKRLGRSLKRLEGFRAV